MTNTVTVSEKRGLFPEYSNLGTMGEKNATTLVFLLPASLQGYDASLVCVTAQGSFIYAVENNTFDLPREILTDDSLDIQLVLKDGSRVIWKSKPCTFTLFPTLDDSGENKIEAAKAEQKEADRAEIGGILSDITGKDFGSSDWDELTDVMNELPIKSDKDILDLSNYTELSHAFEHCKTAPSLITGQYALDREDPDDPDSKEVLIKLPYLRTPNAQYSERTPISNQVVECGFDVSGSADTICHYNEVSMFNRGGAAELLKLELTSCECVPYTACMFSNLSHVVELKLVEGDNYADSYDANYYKEKFRNMSSLQAITGTPLDMSRGTNYLNTFSRCSQLRHVRFKPFTISHDLDLSDCGYLFKKYESTLDSPDTLLSVINGVRSYSGTEDPITIKFSTFVKSYLSSWRCKIDETTGLYVFSDRNYDNTMWTVLTAVKGVVIA